MKQRYYLPFLAWPMSVEALYISFCNIFLSGILYIGTGILSETDKFTEALTILNALFIIISLFSLVIYLIRKLLYKFQIACLILLAINFLILLFNVDFICFLMFTDNNWYSWYALLYIAVVLATIIGSSAYYVYCYKVKKERVLGYGGEAKKKKKSSSPDYGMIFVIVLLAPALLPGYFQNLFGLSFGLFFSVVCTGIVIDPLYAVYLIYKDRKER